MASQLVASPSEADTAPPAAEPTHARAERFVRRLVRRRVHITLVIFTAVVLIDLFVVRSRPRNLLTLTDALAIAGVLLVIAGLAVRTWAAGTLRKRRELATSGPYAWIRHPLYFGSFLMMLGFGTLIQDPLTLLVVLGPIAWLYWQAVKNEERQIAELFPIEWTQYAARVPRFIPWRPVQPRLGEWSLAQWSHNGEYQAWTWSVIALIGIQLWHSWQ